ncbi:MULTISPECIES: hypothetical protein [Sorangium]|uniref:Uncharacterized protein n=1 Tax=Sorangium cellulosum (strain So ce56) TaxID=448385 RepID=A9EVZ9_SORC5|nr:hypothetical protein [Sorangium cellulosum]CAN94273.1 hypothetical protein predicted by Glimmer/Critica [Sorangium cellulosum So ce56]
MAKRTTIARKGRTAPALGPGLHAGTIELRQDERFRVRTLGGELVTAVLDDAVDPDLAKECLRSGCRVILADDGARGPVILGALQTSLPVARDRDGHLVVSAKKIRLKAAQSLVLDAGESSLRLEPNGAVRMEGDRLVIDVGSLVRFLAASVEFP